VPRHVHTVPCLGVMAAKCSSCPQVRSPSERLRVKLYTRQSPSTVRPIVVQEILENIIQREWPNDPKAPRQFYEVPFSPEMAAAQQRGNIEQATAVLHGANFIDVSLCTCESTLCLVGNLAC
jgi:hypothetical protein